MTDLSPQAQAVWDAVWDTAIQCGDIKGTRRSQVAAALRAAADQMGCYQSKSFLYSIADAMKLIAIADELENLIV